MSESDVISLVSDRLLSFKVQLVCLIVAIAMTVGGYLMWQDIKASAATDQQKGVITSER